MNFWGTLQSIAPSILVWLPRLNFDSLLQCELTGNRMTNEPEKCFSKSSSLIISVKAHSSGALAESKSAQLLLNSRQECTLCSDPAILPRNLSQGNSYRLHNPLINHRWNFQGTCLSWNRWPLNCCVKMLSSADHRTFLLCRVSVQRWIIVNSWASQETVGNHVWERERREKRLLSGKNRG
jgi:hypothetical protein